VVTITVNNRKLEAKPGDMLLEALRRAGVDVPRYIRHED